MSCLAVLSEAASWLAEWEAHHPPTSALRHVERAAREQRANYESCRASGLWPSSFKPDEYRRSVEMIEAALPRMRERAEAWTRRREEKEAFERAAAEAERARIMEKWRGRIR